MKIRQIQIGMVGMLIICLPLLAWGDEKPNLALKVTAQKEVIFKDKDECAEQVKITLTGRGKKQTMRTNNFGDFEFEGLGEGEEFAIKMEHSDYSPQSFKVKTNLDVYLGEIPLKRSSKR